MERCIFRGEMGVIERLAVCFEHAPFAVVAALAGLFASLVSCPEASVRSLSKTGVRDHGGDTLAGADHEGLGRGRRAANFKKTESRAVRPARCTLCFSPLSRSLANHAVAECLSLPSDSGAAPLALLTRARTPLSKP